MKLRVKILPYERIEEGGLRGILKDVRENTLIMIDAKLSVDEETHIIQETMKKISDRFPGIELNSIELGPSSESTVLGNLKNRIVEMLMGKKRGVTIIGSAKIIKKIEKNPQNLLLDLSA
jgi:hypothetical protein